MIKSLFFEKIGHKTLYEKEENLKFYKCPSQKNHIKISKQIDKVQKNDNILQRSNV